MTDENAPDELGQGQAVAVAALLSEPTLKAAAKRAGVGERTLRRWLDEDPGFRQALTLAEGQAIDAATRRLIGLADDAIKALGAILRNTKAPPAVRLRAACAVLDYLLKMRELRNVEERLAALEKITYGTES